MRELISALERDGCTVVPSVATEQQLERATAYCDSVELSGAGSRDLLKLPWCADIARSLRLLTPISTLLGESRTAVQCTLFVKDPQRNWLVPMHRDYSVPVKAKVASSHWSAWSIKQSVPFGRPPQPVLESLLAVRIHLEDTDASNGALQVVNGSHRSTATTGKRSSHFVPRGGALVMRPLLLHASSKLVSGNRRVLHFLYGPSDLPDGAEWANAV
jgi:hypothetical protein